METKKIIYYIFISVSFQFLYLNFKKNLKNSFKNDKYNHILHYISIPNLHCWIKNKISSLYPWQGWCFSLTPQAPAQRQRWQIRTFISLYYHLLHIYKNNFKQVHLINSVYWRRPIKERYTRASLLYLSNCWGKLPPLHPSHATQKALSSNKCQAKPHPCSLLRMGAKQKIKALSEKQYSQAMVILFYLDLCSVSQDLLMKNDQNHMCRMRKK